jgi:DNA-binding NarL/FixJ family response regulator
MINIGIVDDHKLFRRSLSLLVNMFDGMRVVAEAENGSDFIKAASTIPMDIVLLDIQMPEMDGFETCAKIVSLFPDIKVIIVSQLTSKESVTKMIHYGAHGYFTKNSEPAHLEAAIKAVDRKGFYFGADLGEVIRDALSEQKRYPIPHFGAILTPRELDIVRMAAREYSSSRIATELFINVRTVETHRKRIMEKTNSKNFLGVVLYAIRNNYISLTDV